MTMATWDRSEGSSVPLGVTWVASEQAYNFALYSSTASRVTLLLYAPEDIVTPIFSYEFDPLKNKTGPVWHARLPMTDIHGACYYSYSVDGPALSADRLERDFFNPMKVLLDPYARAIFFPPAFDRTAALGSGSNAGKAPLGVLPNDETFDWGDDRRPQHDSDLVIYELHVRGFTMNPNAGISAAKRGTFFGVLEKIPYLKELGVTALELMPIFEFDDTEPNYWGYMPINFFSPHHRYATGQGTGDPIREFKQVVKALHEAGIEVILDVVYNHTGEGNEAGPMFSFRGIDNNTYYIPSRDPNRLYADFTGTGNTLNCADRVVRQLVVDSLRYWVRETHVDGFRFDLASVFSRNSDGSINFDDPPIFGDLASDPDLAGVRMIAEPWEGNAQYPNYELGFEPLETQEAGCCCWHPACVCPPTPAILQRSFPGIGWRQWNDKFRNTVRHFVKSDPGLVGDLMTRIYGSADVFPDTLREAYRPYQSLNYICSHDGPTLYDLVAYNSFDSWNCGGRDGEEGVSAETMKLRKQQVRNLCCLLMLSNGTPMFRAGDEFLQTQQGNGNPYNIDNDLTWLDWNRLRDHSDIFHFFQKMIAFRKQHPSIARPEFWREDITWYGVGREVDWAYDSRALAYCLHGASRSDDDLYVMVNAYWRSIVFSVQEGTAEEWKRVIDTSLDSPREILDPAEVPRLSSLSCTVEPRSIVVLIRLR